MNFSKPAPWGNVMTKHRLKSTLCVLKVAIINSTPPPQYLIWIHSVYLGCGQVFRALIIDAYPLTNRAIFFFWRRPGQPSFVSSIPFCFNAFMWWFLAVFQKWGLLRSGCFIFLLSVYCKKGTLVFADSSGPQA